MIEQDVCCFCCLYRIYVSTFLLPHNRFTQTFLYFGKLDGVSNKVFKIITLHWVTKMELGTLNLYLNLYVFRVVSMRDFEVKASDALVYLLK